MVAGTKSVNKKARSLAKKVKSLAIKKLKKCNGKSS